MKFSHAPNDVVLNRYTIRRGVGVGGFGEVYFAVSAAGKEVALKQVQRHLDVEVRGVSHCLNLKHPNLVSLHDLCGDDDGQTWVVMEYVAGPNLREVLDDLAVMGKRNEGPFNEGLSDEDIRHWFSGMAAGVAHLHSAGLVHRDLKPGNLFDDAGTIKVGDYGLSKFISTSHRGGHTESVGTFHYMAPEIGRGQYGREIDIYAMGIILFELLTGAPPYDGETPQEIVVKHLTDSPDLSKVSQKYRAAIAACLEKDPLHRPKDVASLMSMLPWSNSPSSQSPCAASSPPASQESSAQPNPNEKAGAGHDAAAFRATLPDVVLSNPSSEEPIARAIRHSFSDLRKWWRNLERSPGSRFMIVMATALILFINTHWLLPVLSLVAFFYVPYYIIRHVVLQVSDPDTYMHTPPTLTSERSAPTRNRHDRSQTTPPRRLSRAEVRGLVRQSLAKRSKTVLVGEWATSGMVSMLVAATLLLIASVIGLRNVSITPLSISPYVWMACVVWLGSFGLLGLGKAWESREGENLPRRLTASCLGACVGTIAYLLSDALMVPLDLGLGRDIDATSLPTSFYQTSGIPKAAAMMAHFAVVFGLLRMWKPVDPLRRSRLSLWAVAVAVIGEWLVHQVVPVPQPAGMLIVGGIIVMTQMSSPWVKTDSLPVSA